MGNWHRRSKHATLCASGAQHVQHMRRAHGDQYGGGHMRSRHGFGSGIHSYWPHAWACGITHRYSDPDDHRDSANHRDRHTDSDRHRNRNTCSVAHTRHATIGCHSRTLIAGSSVCRRRSPWPRCRGTEYQPQAIEQNLEGPRLLHSHMIRIVTTLHTLTDGSTRSTTMPSHCICARFLEDKGTGLCPAQSATGRMSRGQSLRYARMPCPPCLLFRRR